MSSTSRCHFFAKGRCINGWRCQFSHEPVKPAGWKTKPCAFFPEGKCKKGDQCNFRHDGSLLSQKVPIWPPSAAANAQVISGAGPVTKVPNCCSVHAVHYLIDTDPRDTAFWDFFWQTFLKAESYSTGAFHSLLSLTFFADDSDYVHFAAVMQAMSPVEYHSLSWHNEREYQAFVAFRRQLSTNNLARV